MQSIIFHHPGLSRAVGIPVLCSCLLLSGPAPVGAQQSDPRTIDIGVVPGKMRYETSRFFAEPGERLKITLNNTDELQHNLIVCARGKKNWEKVAQEAIALGIEGPIKQYVPDSKLVLFASKMVDPHQSDTITFTAPGEEGVYPYVCTFPGHATLMRGEMLVSRNPRGLTDLRYRYFEGSWDRLPDFESLTPVESGKLESDLLTLAPKKRDDGFAFVYDADLLAPKDGEYVFALESDDGSRLLLDGHVVVDHDGIHGEEQKVAKVQLTRGAHRLQVQYFEQAGGEALKVAWSGPGFKSERLSDGGTIAMGNLSEFQPEVGDRTRVFRVLLPGASARSMAVGLPGGMNFCFDAADCSVKYGWSGGFVDVGPERGDGRGRGGGVCRILGQRFEVGDLGFPLRVSAQPDAAGPVFEGYRLTAEGPVFQIRAHHMRIEQTVTASRDEPGLTYAFRVMGKLSSDLEFSVNPRGLKLSSTAGTWVDGTLTVPRASSNEFSVTIQPE